MIAKHDGTEVFQMHIGDTGCVEYIPVPGGVVLVAGDATLLPGVRLVYEPAEGGGYTNVRLEEDEDRKTDRADRAADRAMRGSLKDVAATAIGVAQSIAMENGLQMPEPPPSPPRKLKVVEEGEAEGKKENTDAQI